MKIFNVKDVETHHDEGLPWFTGKVDAQFLVNKETAKTVQVGLITFHPGCRNLFHTHAGEQILYVTEGKGILATKEKQTEVGPGSIIYIPPGEVHYHGATKDSAFTHLAVIVPDEKGNFKETIVEKV
jgi:quercetin dioxygenase-like cupin family protein